MPGSENSAALPNYRQLVILDKIIEFGKVN